MIRVRSSVGFGSSGPEEEVGEEGAFFRSRRGVISVVRLASVTPVVSADGW